MRLCGSFQYAGLTHLFQEERDDDSHGGDSDDEIAELRIQALLSKRVNEAEVSPARDPPQKQRNVNKPFPAGRPRPFRPAQVSSFSHCKFYENAVCSALMNGKNVQTQCVN